MSMFKFGRHESGQSFLRRVKDHRQGKADRMFRPIITDDIKEMEIVVVQDVPKNHFCGIKTLFFHGGMLSFLSRLPMFLLLGKSDAAG